jgi:hypothetical protein
VNLQTFVFCAAIIAVFLIYRYRQRQRAEYFDALQLSEAVQELAAVMEQLENADRLTADLEACRPGLLHRFFRASWMSSDGKNRTIDLCATGRGRASRGLAEAARAERDRLNQETIDRIRALACALDAGDAAQATVFEPLPDDLSEDETAGQSGIYSGHNDDARQLRGSA